MNDDAFAERVQTLAAERDEAIRTREALRQLEGESYSKVVKLLAERDELRAKVSMLQEALEICRETESDF